MKTTTPSSPIRLVNPTNRDLETAFSIHVVGWQIDARHDGYWIPPGKKPLTRGYYTEDPPSYVKSFDSILPYLEPFHIVTTEYVRTDRPHRWRVDLYRGLDNGNPDGWANDASLARAAVIALLRANGVVVEIAP